MYTSKQDKRKFHIMTANLTMGSQGTAYDGCCLHQRFVAVQRYRNAQNSAPAGVGT